MTIFDTEGSLSDEEIVEVRQHAKEYIRLWRRRTLYATVALILSCALVYLFSKGHPLHKYWEFGKYLIIVSTALLVVFVYCIGLFWSAWQALRDVEKGQA